jgi:hypothetical protein
MSTIHCDVTGTVLEISLLKQGVKYIDNEYSAVKNRIVLSVDRLCGLVVTVPGWRTRGLGFDSWCYQ